MSPHLLPSVSLGSRALRLSAAVRPTGDARSFCTLDGERQGHDAPSRALLRPTTPCPACQNDTAPTGSHWDGPRLRPAFVAQVIGQVLMDEQSRALRLAPPAYRYSGVAQIAPGRVLDTGV
jgi:hypothetical protein